MAKKKGGVGRHVTANTPRLFLPNLKTKRIWVPELNRHITVKLSARALKTISRNGAFETLKKAGLVYISFLTICKSASVAPNALFLWRREK